MAIECNLYNLSAFGSTVGFASGGAAASNLQDASPIDFHSGDKINATVTYNGTTLDISLVDATTSATFNTSEAINLPQILGGSGAYVGFTGATGNDDSVQHIDNWDFTGVGLCRRRSPSRLRHRPVRSPAPKAHLSVTAVSNSGYQANYLTYSWRAG